MYGAPKKHTQSLCTTCADIFPTAGSRFQTRQVEESTCMSLASSSLISNAPCNSSTCHARNCEFLRDHHNPFVVNFSALLLGFGVRP